MNSGVLRYNRLDPQVGGADFGPPIGLALVWPERHRPLELRGNGQRRVDPEVGRDRRSVDDVKSAVAVQPLVGVDDSGLWRIADRTAAQEVRGHRDVSDLAEVPPGSPPILRATRLATSLPTGIQVGLAAPWPGPEVSRYPSRVLRPDTVMELSNFCMTRRMIVFSGSAAN